MSLFGTPSEEDPAAADKADTTLFDDETKPAPISKSSLFADDDPAPGSSPWDMPIAPKTHRAEMVRNLLAGADIPEGYVDIFDNALKGDDNGGSLGLAGVTKVLSAAKLSTDDQSRIVDLISVNGRLGDLDQNQFNVLLALIGLAQNHEDITLDGVDERRKNLPVPKLPGLSTTRELLSSSILAAKPPQRTSTPPRDEAVGSIPKDSMEFPEADPWGSPSTHPGDSLTRNPPKTNGTPKSNHNKQSIPRRTTSNFTTADLRDSVSSLSTNEIPTTRASGVWGAYDTQSPTSESRATNAAIGGSGLATTTTRVGDRPPVATHTRNVSSVKTSGPRMEENITIALLPEKEGMFMFQHHNYQVTSIREGSKVVRRYSDFVWLLDCLHKRYPFRQLPLLPPKRVAVNGKHLAADNTFIEKRRRGLVRFVNALVRHPVLGQEQLVTMFLKVPTELVVWRKQANLSIQEEFAGKHLPPGLEDSLPPNLTELFNATRAGILRSAEIYINLCNLMDRLSKRTEGLAADHLRLALSLQTLTDASHDTYATDTNEVPLLNEGLQATAKHVSNCQTLLEDEAKAWDQGVLEDLKRQRDSLVSVRDLFDRRDRYDTDHIPSLERRIESNEAKLVGIRNKPEGTIKPGEEDKVTEAIIKDKESIVAQHARGVFVKECIRDELLYFQKSQYQVSQWCQNWSEERVKYSELQADNWRQLHEELEAMPLGE